MVEAMEVAMAAAVVEAMVAVVDTTLVAMATEVGMVSLSENL